MEMPYFVWNGIKSSDIGIVVNKLPSITRAEERIELTKVAGRNGYLSSSDDTFDSVLRSCECTLLETADLRQVFSLLRGNGKITFSHEPEYEYDAVIVNKIPFDQIVPSLYKFIIHFDCQPFAYLLDSEKIIIDCVNDTIGYGDGGYGEYGYGGTLDNITIYNQGTYESQPELKIYGSGNVSITINNETFTINDLVDYIVIDSEMMDCYKDTQPLNNLMIGEFPILEVGENTMFWTGSISKIEINGRWRCL